MKKLGNGRAVAVLLTSVLVAALVLAFVVVQTRAATLQAPASTERRAYDDGVYTVRLGDTVGTEPGRFTAWLTGRQAAKLVTTPGVLSVTRLPGRAAVVPMLPGCHSATASAAPAPVPSPSPLPAPIPPADGGVTSPGGDHTAQSPSGPSRPGRPGRMDRNEQGVGTGGVTPQPGDLEHHEERETK